MTKPSAVFVGYQTSSVMPPLALFNVVDPDNTTGRHQSTVGLKTLASLGIEPPTYPVYQPIQWVTADVGSIHDLERA